ncbi:MAG: ribbon-helix-helix protein, CopG family [Alphaproteobacteria bacterium]|nr:ribbon-helix-helix protein, CopG family [Alphaproteobacteria bacterium]
MPATIPVTVRVSAETNAKLERIAKATERSKSKLLAGAIDAYIESERQFLEGMERGLADMKAGRVIDNDEMMLWLDSWGGDKELPPPAGLRK